MKYTSADMLPQILLVDDSPHDLRLLSEMLRAKGFRLILASDGRQGYQRAVSRQPDLILMDVEMPDMDGFTACRLLKTDPATRHIPVIFLTAKNAPEERLQGFHLGGVDYVSKPFLAEEVIARIRIHLNHPQPMSHQTWVSGTARRTDEVIAQAAVQLIQDRLEQMPPLPELARMVGAHEKKLCAIFHTRFGMPVSAFIGEARIRAARKLLEETDIPVQQIAEQVGFGTGAGFATTFRKRMGMTPSVYRQSWQDKEEEA
ncbi:MAG: response regulator [Gallionella sp.]|nr:response regulator [Gallionella sp.]